MMQGEACSQSCLSRVIGSIMWLESHSLCHGASPAHVMSSESEEPSEQACHHHYLPQICLLVFISGRYSTYGQASCLPLRGPGSSNKCPIEGTGDKSCGSVVVLRFVIAKGMVPALMLLVRRQGN